MEPAQREAAIQRVFISMPAKKIDGHYWDVIERGRLNLEIGLDSASIDALGKEKLTGIARRLKGLGLNATVHAPFNEIFLGAPDRLVREAALARLDGAFDIAEAFSPRAVVVHLNFEERRFRYLYDTWLEHVIPNIIRYAKRCAGMGALLSLENVYEERPEAMVEVFERLKGYPVGHCLDVGHVSAFSDTPLAGWFDATGPYIRHFHLHDNDGTRDHHLPIGSGSIRFGLVRDFIAKMKEKPIITLEPHSEEDIWRTLDGFVSAGLLDAMA